MTDMLEQQIAIAAGNEVVIEGAMSPVRVIPMMDKTGLWVEQGTDIIWLPDAAAVDALIAALVDKKAGME